MLISKELCTDSEWWLERHFVINLVQMPVFSHEVSQENYILAEKWLIWNINECSSCYAVCTVRKGDKGCCVFKFLNAVP